MSAYLITSSVVFGLIVVAHVFRIVQEGARLATEPSFVLTTAAAAALCVWALSLLKSSARADARKSTT